MKHLIFILLFALKFLPTFAQVDTTTKHCWYYMWSINTSRQNGWGENHVMLNHKPSKKEIMDIIASTAFSKRDPDLKFVKIDEIIYFPTEEDYYKSRIMSYPSIVWVDTMPELKKYIVKDVRRCRCIAPTFTIWAANLEGTQIVTIDISNETGPQWGDTISYDEKNWKWKKKVLHLCDKVRFESLPLIHPKNIEIDTIGHHGITYIIRDGGGVPVDCYHLFNNWNDRVRDDVERRMEQSIIDDFKKLGVNILFNHK